MTALRKIWMIPLVTVLVWSGAETRAGESTSEPETSEAVSDTSPAPRDTSIVANFTLKARDEKVALEAIRALAQGRGGYLARLSDAAISVRVPRGALSELAEAIAQQGIVITKDLRRQDLTDEIARLGALLRSKREILGKVNTLLMGADFNSTLDVERTMNQLVSEIEGIQGQLRVMHERIRYAVVEVSFQIKERERYVYVKSPFEWLNRVHIDAFLEEFDDE